MENNFKNRAIIFGFIYIVVFVILIFLGRMVGRVEDLYADFGATQLPLFTRIVLIWNQSLLLSIIVNSLLSALIAVPSIFLKTKFLRSVYLIFIVMLMSLMVVAIYLPIYQLSAIT